MAVLLLSLLVLLFTSEHVLLQDPCATYSKFAGPVSRSFEYVQDPSDITNGFCDISLKTGWYRLQVDNKDVDLANTAPPPGACNTLYPVWLNGQVPTTLNQETNIKACVVASTEETCETELSIKVINCGEYRIYRLPPVHVCPSSYCFLLSGPCPDGFSSESGSHPGCSDLFPSIDLTPRVSPLLGTSTVDNSFEDLRFECAFDSPNDGYLYDVIWRINGNEVARFTKFVAASLPQSELLETTWKNDYKLGMNVQCAIRVRGSENGVPSPEHKSDTFFAGLKIIDPVQLTLVLNEGDTATIRYQATVPIPCKQNFPCSVLFRDLTYNNYDGVCQRNDTGHCGFYVLAHQWNAVRTLFIEAAYDNTYGNRVSQVFLKSVTPVLNGPGVHVWADVEPQPVLVNIIDGEAQVDSSYCDVNNDPHFRSFDGRRFDVHISGEFVLYRHKSLPLEVRGFFQPCSPGRMVPACVCGAAVRSGSQIFVYSTCKDNVSYQTTRVRVYGCNKNQMRVTSSNNGMKYTVELPTGTVVEISYGIRIKASPADVSQTEGLCGNFNGNEEDEYISPEGIQHDNDCDSNLFNLTIFCIVNKYGVTWRINDTAKSFYGYPEIDLGPTPVGRCYCEPDTTSQYVTEVICENVPPPQCGNQDPVITDEYCTQLDDSQQRRKKRDTDSTQELNDDDVLPALPSYEISDLKIPMQDWPAGWNLQKAIEHCESVFGQSPISSPCSKVSNLERDNRIQFCAIDILLSGSINWTLASLEMYKEHCMSEVQRNFTLWVPMGNELPVREQVMNKACPRDCSFQGTCDKGRCVCNKGWIGVDCSVNATKSPDVTGLPRQGLCNLKARKCDRTVVFGTRFVRSDLLTCKFVQVYIDYERAVLKKVKPVYVTKAYFRHSAEIVCTVPADVVLGTTDEKGFPVGYFLSVSNNNNLFSDDKLYLPYDSDDFTCTISNGNVNCKKVQKKNLAIRLTNTVHVMWTCWLFWMSWNRVAH